MRWATKTILIVGLLVVLVAIGFRVAAAIREQGARADLAPTAGELVPRDPT